MDDEIEIRKIEAEPRRSIPAIAVTAIVLAAALLAIILVQKYANAPPGETQPVEQTQPG